MSDDLVKRARRLDTCIFPTERSKCLCGELADHIEKLETALREIIDIHPFKDPEGDASVKAVVDLMFHINLTARRAINTF